MTMYPPPPETPAPVYQGGASGPRAGFWTRFAALFIDGIIIGLIPIIIIAASSGSAGKTLGYLLAAFLGVAYETYFIGGPSGQTLGKKALGIRVIDFNTGGPIGYGRALLRWVGRIVSSFICYLGYFWMLWDKENQCWHDKMANDVVVPVSAYPVS